MTSEIKAVAVVRFNEEGFATYHLAADESVRLFVVDERSPHDRVYEITSRCDGAEVAEILGNDPIGHCGDTRHAALVARINGETFQLIDGGAQ